MDKLINVWVLEMEGGKIVFDSIEELLKNIEGDIEGAWIDERRTYSITPETMYQQNFNQLIQE